MLIKLTFVLLLEAKLSIIVLCGVGLCILLPVIIILCGICIKLKRYKEKITRKGEICNQYHACSTAEIIKKMLFKLSVILNEHCQVKLSRNEAYETHKVININICPNVAYASVRKTCTASNA